MSPTTPPTRTPTIPIPQIGVDDCIECTSFFGGGLEEDTVLTFVPAHNLRLWASAYGAPWWLEVGWDETYYDLDGRCWLKAIYITRWWFTTRDELGSVVGWMSTRDGGQIGFDPREVTGATLAVKAVL